MKRVIIYTRVSTKDQNIDMQLIDLRNYANARGFRIIKEYTDIGSGANLLRENYLKLLDDVRKRKTDVVLVWKFDRFARSTKELLNALDEFQSLGVDFISYKENVDTSTPAGKILFAVISAFAEFERDIIRERILNGMDKAKAKGKIFGRPSIPQYKKDRILELSKMGKNYKEICDLVRISKTKYYEIINTTHYK